MYPFLHIRHIKEELSALLFESLFPKQVSSSPGKYNPSITSKCEYIKCWEYLMCLLEKERLQLNFDACNDSSTRCTSLSI